jgi:membrane protease YdiL (CAAX protease family)
MAVDIGGRLDFLWGLAAAIPPLVFGGIATSPWGLRFAPLKRIFLALERSPLGDFIRQGDWAHFAVLAAFAGLGEELLFRGVLQPKIGLLLSALVFGLLHALTPTYFIAATILGLYMGGLTEWMGGSIGAAAATHALYDFVVLVLYQRRIRAAA